MFLFNYYSQFFSGKGTQDKEIIKRTMRPKK